MTGFNTHADAGEPYQKRESRGDPHLIEILEDYRRSWKVFLVMNASFLKGHFIEFNERDMEILMEAFDNMLIPTAAPIERQLQDQGVSMDCLPEYDERVKLIKGVL